MIGTNPEYFNMKQVKDANMWPLQHLSAYGMIPYIKRLKYSVTGIEIGVLKGENIYVMLEECPNIQKIYGIDNYKPHTDYETVRTPEDMENYKRVTKENLDQFGDRVEIIEEDSDKACKRFEPESVDYILVDGDHTPDGVKADLLNYYPLLKKGGYIFIHDFRYGPQVYQGTEMFRNETKVRIPINISKNFIAFWVKR